MSVPRLLALLPAVLGPVAAIALLFGTWFDAGETFADLHAGEPGVILEPSAWDASALYAGAIVALSLVTIGAAVACAYARFAAWTVGAGAAAAGALAVLVLRASPPDPPRSTYVTGGQAYDPTALPIAAMLCLVAAALGVTAWALATRRG